MAATTTLLTLALAATPALASAQAAPQPGQAPQAPAKSTQPPASDDNEDGPDIVVQGAKQPGAVIGDIPPEQQLGPADIRSYGVSSVSELLTELAPQTLGLHHHQHLTELAA